MEAAWKRIVTGLGILSIAAFAGATDLSIHLKGSGPLTRVTAQYQCDSQGVKMGLPTGAFSVEYLNGAGNSLAVLPIHGNSLVFANVTSGSGARYAAGEYIWWDAAGRSISLSSDSIAGKMRSECRLVNRK
jgi:membrane-bound inhibitor of C-type lysozyme